MSRPETHDDLTGYRAEGHRIAKIHAAEIARFPTLGMHLLAALAEADRLGLSIKDGEIIVPPSTEELDEQLVQEQRVWDGYSALYGELLAGRVVEVEKWRRGMFSDWIAREGLAPVSMGSVAEVTR